MWHKHYQIAKRRFAAGRFSTVESHVLEALRFAKASGNNRQIAETLRLLSAFYRATHDPRQSEALLESIESAEKVYGSDSLESAEQHEHYADLLEEAHDTQGSENHRLMAMRIVEKHDNAELTLRHLDALVMFYMRCEKWSDAEVWQLKAISLRNDIFGAVSKRSLRDGDRYREIVRNLHRDSESSTEREPADVALERIFGADFAKKTHDSHERSNLKEKAIFDGLDISLDRIQSLNTDRFRRFALGLQDDVFIAQLREAQEDLRALAEERLGMENIDSFTATLLYLFEGPRRRVQRCLARLLRFRNSRENRRERLIEAAGYLSEMVSQRGDLEDNQLLLFILMDLALIDCESDSKLTAAIDDAPECAAKLYSNALFLYLREAKSRRARHALSEALSFNSHVPRFLFSDAKHYVPTSYVVPQSPEEAQEYCWAATEQWLQVNGAKEFFEQVWCRTSVPNKAFRVRQIDV